MSDQGDLAYSETKRLLDVVNPTREQLVAIRDLVLLSREIAHQEESDDHRDECRNRVSVRAWQVIRTLVFQRDGYECQYCGDHVENPHCDHIIPLSRGGLTVPDNLTTACGPCNWSKRDKTPEEWMGKL